jgi:hypothetical protein
MSGNAIARNVIVDEKVFLMCPMVNPFRPD